VLLLDGTSIRWSLSEHLLKSDVYNNLPEPRGSLSDSGHHFSSCQPDPYAVISLEAVAYS